MYDKIKKIDALKSGVDQNQQYHANQLKKLFFTHDKNNIKNSNIYIVCVPTPVTKNNNPNLKHLKEASILIGKSLSKNDTVIFESTVYPDVLKKSASH